MMNLSFGEIWQLVKCFLSVLLGCLLIFALPYALLIFLTTAITDNTTEENYSWVTRIAWFGFFAWLAYMILSNMEGFFLWWKKLFDDLAEMVKKASKLKKIIFTLFIFGFFMLWLRYPIFAFWFSILVFLPGGYTYEKYKEILSAKRA